MSLQRICPSLVLLLREYTAKTTYRVVSSTVPRLGRHVSTTSCLYKKKTSESKGEEESIDVDDPMKSAAKSVAESLPGDAEKTESALLQQLRAHAKLTQAQREGRETTPAKPSSDMSTLLSSMKVQKEPRDFRLGNLKQPMTSRGDRKARIEKLKLFSEPPLGIFTNKTTQPAASQSKRRSLWDEVEAEALDRLALFPPENPFEEMVQMTREGKLWTFPINNEAGMVDEEKTGFHEHVFLEGLIEDFPKRGPVRVFMELVITGLSKNPYLSVTQKHEHIDWFRQYFKGKQNVLEESLGAEGVMKSVTENQLQ